MTAFILGLFAGATVGILVAALCSTTRSPTLLGARGRLPDARLAC